MRLFFSDREVNERFRVPNSDHRDDPVLNIANRFDHLINALARNVLGIASFRISAQFLPAFIGQSLEFLIRRMAGKNFIQ